MLDAFTIKPDSTRVGSASYGIDGQLNFKLNQFDSVSNTRNAIKRLHNPLFGLSLHDGLRTVSESLFIEENGARIGVPRSLVVFTTGKASQPFTNELEKLKGTKIIAIGIGPDADMDDLDKLVENNDGKTFTVPKEGTDADIDNLIKDITKATNTGNILFLVGHCCETLRNNLM